jgi:hypothetical protein
VRLRTAVVFFAMIGNPFFNSRRNRLRAYLRGALPVG